MSGTTKPRTLYEKIFDDHVVAERDDGTILLYIGNASFRVSDMVVDNFRQTSHPRSHFTRLESRGLQARRPDLTLATSDHNVPTTTRRRPVKTASFLKNTAARLQVQTLEHNVQQHGIPYLGLNSSKQGIVHIIGPELGFTLPGTTVVCGDSHTSTHGAFGALAFGIGTSEVEHVLATQTIVATRWRNMQIIVEGALRAGVGSKDLILFIIGKIGTSGATGMVIEFSGPVIGDLSMESRMALCNMSIEAGARAGLIAPDSTTLQYIKGRPMAPDPSSNMWEQAQNYWQSLSTDSGAHFDKIVLIDATQVSPTVTWGTSPEQVVPIDGSVPFPADFEDPVKQESCKQALAYMALRPGTRMRDIAVDKVFIGSCTNARVEDFRVAAAVLAGKKISSTIKLALAVPGSGTVKLAAEAEGLDVIFKKAGFEWREAGCSLCVGLNEDALLPYERCASTSNRNFESRQGTAGRTHLVSPGVAAATSLTGRFASFRQEDCAQLSRAAETTPPHYTDGTIDWSGSNTIDCTFKTSNFPHNPALKLFSSVRGKVAVLDRANIDTDAIFPKQFCTTIERGGLGNALFHNLRYDPAGNLNTSFILNHGEYQDCPILLVTGPNFGCGSSREHAVWALQDFGFRTVLAPSFADIFYNNCFKNGLLPGILSSSSVERIMEEVNASGNIEVDLASQAVLDMGGRRIGNFEIDNSRKTELLNGLDEISTTLKFEGQIVSFETNRNLVRSWVEGSVRQGLGPTFSLVQRQENTMEKAEVDSISLKW
ncbi:3-isopropylmalate dehydratase [Lachnellula suecica]|uniref:3-isopropylmalate dehydratase n=1 Tax=Lachnellula suecica TaxID=602035 RepID=A0A8T9CGI8_9HELO|nr:3-isopropylmalate dehydratase [Lachnellula suecica]